MNNNAFHASTAISGNNICRAAIVFHAPFGYPVKSRAMYGRELLARQPSKNELLEQPIENESPRLLPTETLATLEGKIAAVRASVVPKVQAAGKLRVRIFMRDHKFYANKIVCADQIQNSHCSDKYFYIS